MNYLSPTQQKDTKLWYYTSYNSRSGTVPIGYCAEDCTGHETREGACEHYKQYIIDHARVFDDRPDCDTKHRCEAEGCNEFTSGYIQYADSYTIRNLCKQHRTKEIMHTLIDINVSYQS